MERPRICVVGACNIDLISYVPRLPALGETLQPFVLLLAPGEDHGLLRRWEPSEIGPGRHYAYAFQWFAMAVVLAGLLAWNFRKRGYRT